MTSAAASAEAGSRRAIAAALMAPSYVAGVVQRARLGQRRDARLPPAAPRTQQEQHGKKRPTRRRHRADRSTAAASLSCYNCGRMSQPVIVPRAEHAISRKRDRPRRAEGALPAAPERLRRLPRRRQRPRPAARTAAQGLRHRHLGAPVPGQAAVPELLDHRPPLPPGARPVRTEDDRGRHVPAAAVRRGARRSSTRSRPPHGIPVDEHHAGQPDRLLHRDNTFGTPEEDAFRRDFTVNALFYDIAIVLDHRLHRRARDLRGADHPLHRRSGRAVPGGSGPHAARRGDGGAAGLLDRSADRRGHRRAPRRDRAQRAGAADGRVLQAAARGRGRARVPHAGGAAPARADRAPSCRKRAADGLWRSLVALDAYRRRFEETPDTLTNAVLLGSLHRAARSHGGPVGAAVAAGRERGRSRAVARASCRWRAATSNGCGRSSACSAG